MVLSVAKIQNIELCEGRLKKTVKKRFEKNLHIEKTIEKTPAPMELTFFMEIVGVEPMTY